MCSSNTYLELSSNPLRFEAVSKARLNNVFYDDSNSQVFTVLTGEVTDVVVKSVNCESSRSFRIEDKGPVVSIKFSPDDKILAVQRNNVSVEFIHFYNGKQSPEKSHSCNMRKASLIGFVWVENYQILYITDNGVELHQLDAIENKMTLSLVKTLQLSVNWSVFCPENKVLCLSSGTLGTTLQPLLLEANTINKLKKIEVELSVIPKPAKLSLLERDVTVCQIYGKPRVLVLGRSASANTTSVTVYTIYSAVSVKKTHVLELNNGGRLAINIYDNLILIHYQVSKSTVIFDIGLEAEHNSLVWLHQPVTLPATIASSMQECELYSANWVMFQPNIVIDAKLGCLWHIQVLLEPFLELITDKCWLLNFLMLRSNSKEIIMKVIKSVIDDMTINGNALQLLGSLFDQVNAVYRRVLEVRLMKQMGSPTQDIAVSSLATFTEVTPENYVDQFDMYVHLFSKFTEQTEADNQVPMSRRLVAILVEYFRSLTDLQIPIDNSLQVLLIESLVQQRAYFQLLHFLQYHVVSDSKHLACLLLSLENLFPAAHQLGVDMLQRLPDATEEITEVLLSKQQILPSLRYLSSMGMEKSTRDLSSRKYLELARLTNNDSLFCSVLNFFDIRKNE
ncbi:regulator of MON1-CCZ1 complex-like [Nilaparvata lugens]|uniref:regulator of MON1-CCZ1 complex-like n=1 Tax=Nilaparvata lugens TaxID=108931 RepID=UPI00193E395F|nr:regulator of MON1-CCZ1 complex-like [Nilaparvata lugens]